MQRAGPSLTLKAPSQLSSSSSVSHKHCERSLATQFMNARAASAHRSSIAHSLGNAQPTSPAIADHLSQGAERASAPSDRLSPPNTLPSHAEQYPEAQSR